MRGACDCRRRARSSLGSLGAGASECRRAASSSRQQAAQGGPSSQHDPATQDAHTQSRPGAAAVLCGPLRARQAPAGARARSTGPSQAPHARPSTPHALQPRACTGTARRRPRTCLARCARPASRRARGAQPVAAKARLGVLALAVLLAARPHSRGAHPSAGRCGTMHLRSHRALIEFRAPAARRRLAAKRRGICGQPSWGPCMRVRACRRLKRGAGTCPLALACACARALRP